MASISHGQDVLALAVVSLQFEANLAHTFCSSAGLDLVGLFALGSRFGTELLIQLLLPALTLLLETLVDIDSTTFWDLAVGMIVNAIGASGIVEA